MLRLICGYSPWSGRRLEEEQYFYDDVKGEWDAHSSGDLVMCLNDLNGHMCWYVDGFDGFHRQYGVGQRKLKEECYYSFVWKKIYACQVHSFREKKRGR